MKLIVFEPIASGTPLWRYCLPALFRYRQPYGSWPFVSCLVFSLLEIRLNFGSGL